MPDIDPADAARQIIDANQYMVLATADAEGVPWISPVWFAHDVYREFLWISRPHRRHSQNLAVRPAVAITIFDSTQQIGTGHCVTMSATARMLDGPALRHAVGIVSRRSTERGGGMFTVDSFGENASLRLYAASAVEQFVVLGNDERVPIEL